MLPMLMYMVREQYLTKLIIFFFLFSNTAWKVFRYGVFLVRIFLHSVGIRENTDQKKNSVFGHFWRSGTALSYGQYFEDVCKMQV